MSVLKTRMFGDTPIANDAYVPIESDADGRTLRPSLFVGSELSQAQLEQAASLVDDLSTLDARARSTLVESIERGDKLVVDFVAFHREELDPDTARVLLGDATTPSETIARLELVGLGVHKDSFGLDYSFGKAHTDELLVVAFDADRNVLRVSHES